MQGDVMRKRDQGPIGADDQRDPAARDALLREKARKTAKRDVDTNYTPQIPVRCPHGDRRGNAAPAGTRKAIDRRPLQAIRRKHLLIPFAFAWIVETTAIDMRDRLERLVPIDQALGSGPRAASVTTNHPRDQSWRPSDLNEIAVRSRHVDRLDLRHQRQL
jgi:hypothetical protein